jgi:SAM-dependent methyltransferase
MTDDADTGHTAERGAWWSPEVLAEKERRVRAGLDAAASDIKNDYAAYKALAHGADPLASGLYLHNEFDPRRVTTVCRDYFAITSAATEQSPRNVADLGSGAGFTTAGLKRVWPDATVVGFELSEDAVAFARRQWPACSFRSGAIRPDEPLAGGPFDVIICQEFYPFTRTDRLSDHETWVEFLRANLTADGVALVMVTTVNVESINATYGSLRTRFPIRRVRLAAPRLARRLPRVLSRIAGDVLAVVRPAWARSIYVVRRGTTA